MNARVPTPRWPIDVRVAIAADLAFIDGLQKLHAKQVGWMPTKQLEGKIEKGHVLVAWASGPCSSPCSSEGVDTGWKPVPQPVGYCIGTDQYFKRDDVGIIYQMNVVPDRQRGLIGATLVKAMFERAAYGCRLFCCWCAQDIAANYFWESLGFIPLAFRAGSRDKGRVHIFWQRRIRAGDETTPYWFPSQTSSGSIREDRLVFPIPPGVHWRDEMPRILPAEQAKLELPKVKEARSKAKRDRVKPPVSTLGRLWFAPPPPPVEARPVENKREAKAKTKNDPALIAAARELRDRWLERVNAQGGASILTSPGKYDVGRALPAPTHRPGIITRPAPQRPAPAIAA